MKLCNSVRNAQTDGGVLLRMRELGAQNGGELIAICGSAVRPLEHRLQSCLLLGQLRYKEALPLLIELGSEEREPRLAWQSLVAVGAIGSFRGTRPILQILRSARSAMLRRGAVIALG